MHEEQQLQLFEELKTFKDEFDRFPTEPSAESAFHVRNGMFQAVDAEVAYALVRSRKPGQIIRWIRMVEHLLAMASSANAARVALSKISVDPQPRTMWPLAIADQIEFVPTPVERLGLEFFRQLLQAISYSSTRVTSFDSAVTFGSIPRADTPPPPRGAGACSRRVPPDALPARDREGCDFYNEQYVVQALLSHSSRYRVLWALELHASAAFRPTGIPRPIRTDQNWIGR